MTKGEPFQFDLEAKVKNTTANYYFEMRVGYEFLPLIRERGDFCTNEQCSKGILKYHQQRLLPSVISPGKYICKTLIYDDTKIPLTCKMFNFELESAKEDETEESKENQ